jgi:hypothetical protein
MQSAAWSLQNSYVFIALLAVNAFVVHAMHCPSAPQLLVPSHHEKRVALDNEECPLTARAQSSGVGIAPAMCCVPEHSMCVSISLIPSWQLQELRHCSQNATRNPNRTRSLDVAGCMLLSVTHMVMRLYHDINDE